jgi:PAS domain S-box-containing protein
MKTSKLLRKALLIQVMLFALITVSISLFSSWHLRESLTQEYQNKGIAISQSIAFIQEHLLTDYVMLQTVIDHFLGMEGVVYVVITNTQGEITTHTFMNSVPEQIMVHLAAQTRKRHISSILESMHTSSQIKELFINEIGTIFDIRFPILMGELGYVHVGLDKYSIGVKIKTAIFNQIILILLLSVISTAIAYVFISRVAKDVIILTEGIKRVQTHDFNTFIEVKSKNEIAFLAEAFNSLVANLREYSYFLECSEERFRVITETIPIPLLIYRKTDGSIFYANQQACKLFGLNRGALLNRQMQEFFENPEEYQELSTRFDYINDYEAQLRKIDGNLLWVTIFLQPIEFKNEESILFTGFDMTGRKQEEEERMKISDQIEYELFLLNKAYERFIPRQFLSLLDKKSIIEVALGDHVEKEMSILFADIRGFTELSEKISPHENFKFINAYLCRMEPAITENNGFIDKYIGDAIMALFIGCADDALKAGIAMLVRLNDYNETRQRPERPAIKIGVGINTGVLMLGTVGGQNRMDGTVISDVVNLASRVEGLTKIYGTSLLITEYSYSKLKNPSKYHIREVDRVKVKGKSKGVTVYEVFDADLPEVKNLKIQTLADFEQGFKLYHENVLDEAYCYFERVLVTNPTDQVARIYLERCYDSSEVGTYLG